MKKILYIEVNRDGTVGGSYYSLLYLLQGLDKSRYEPHVLFCQDSTFLARFREVTPHVYVNDYGPSYSPPLNTFGHIVKWPYRFLTKVLLKQFRIRRIIEAVKPDLVHLNNSYAAGHEWVLACWLQNIKVVAHDRGTPYPCSFQTKMFARLLDAILCVSESYKKNVESQHLRPRLVRRVYDGIPPEQYEKIQASDAEKVRREFELNPGDPVIGIVGNIIRWKGQDLVLKAMKDVARAYPATKCLIVGKVARRAEPYKEELDRFIRENGLERNIVFTGFREDVPQILSVLDVVVHASTEPEPFGLVILEGMAMGKPVIATNHGGPCEIVLHKETGFLVNHQDHAEMAEAITYCIQNRARAAEMGRRGRERFVKMFSNSRMVEETESIYKDLFA